MATADDLLHARRLEWRLRERLESLPEIQRTAYRLLQQEGLSLKGAAEALGTSVTAVKLRAHRAYQALRAVLREAGEAIMSAGLRAQVLAAAAAEASPTRATVNRRNAFIGMVAAASGVGAFVIFAALMSEGTLVRLGGEVAQRHLERSSWLVLATAGGALGIAAAALWLALGRGRSMLGRSRRWLLYGGLLIPICLLAWKVGCSMAFGDAMVRWPERLGLRCLALSIVVAVGPLLSFVTMRRTAFLHPALNGAALGLAAGACAWVAVDLWCPVAHVPHLLLGHVLPLLVLAGAGALLGQALLSLRHR